VSAPRLGNRQARQDRVRCLRVQPFVPRIVDLRDGGFGRGEAALLALETAPVVSQFVTRHAHQPGKVHFGEVALAAGADRGEESLAGKILG